MSKYGIDYILNRGMILNERVTTNQLLLSVFSGEIGDKFRAIAEEVLYRTKNGKTSTGTPLVDSEGERAPGITSSADNRRWSWITFNLMEHNKSFPDKEKLKISSDSLRYIYAKTKFGQAFRDIPNKTDKQKFTIMEKWFSYIDSSISGNAKLTLIRYSMRDDTNYLLADGSTYFAVGKSFISSTYLLKAASALIVKHNPEILDLEDFKSDVLSETGISDYMNGNTGRVTTSSSYSSSMAKKKLENLGASTDNISQEMRTVEHVSSLAKPILIKINRAYGYKIAKLKKSNKNTPVTRHSFVSPAGSLGVKQKFDLITEPDKGVDNIVNDITLANDELIYIINSIIDESSKIKNEVRDIEEKNPNSRDDISDILDVVSDKYGKSFEYINNNYKLNIGTLNILLKSLTSNTSMDLDTFLKYLDVIDEKYKTESMKATTDMIRLRINLSNVVKSLQVETSTDKYQDYDDDILKSVLKDETEREIFDMWYKTIYVPMKTSTIKNMLRIMGGNLSSYEMNKKMDEFQSSKTNIYGDTVDRNIKLDYNKLKEELKSKPKSEWSEIDYSNAIKLGLVGNDKVDSKDESDAYNFLQQNIKSKYDKYSESSYVLDYMTEQITKDNLNKPKGEFKDRGFKKPINNLHWLMLQG